MKEYKRFDILKEDISHFEGLEKERIFAPRYSYDMLPLDISILGITNPDPNYYIKRDSSRCFILEYIVSGKGYLTVNGQTYSLGANDTYLIHPGDECEYYSDKNDPYKKYWINFRSYFLADFLKAYNLSEPRVFNDMNIEDSFKGLFELENISDANDDIYLPASEILYAVAFKLVAHVKKVTSNSSLAARVKSELQHSIGVPITLEMLEKKFYRTKSDIIKQFKKAYGITPYAYMINLKIQAAKNFLANTQKTASEIAEYLCFSSGYHFSSIFKNKTGFSPREYRKISQNSGGSTKKSKS